MSVRIWGYIARGEGPHEEKSPPDVGNIDEDGPLGLLWRYEEGYMLKWTVVSTVQQKETHFTPLWFHSPLVLLYHMDTVVPDVCH